MFVTNNSNKRRAAFVEQLEQRGVDFCGRSQDDKVGMMISAAFTTARYLQANSLRRPFVLTSDVGILEELALAGITEYVSPLTRDGVTDPDFASPNMMADELPEKLGRMGHVDCIVVGWDMGLTARKAAAAVNLIKWHEAVHSSDDNYRPLPLIACSGDAGGVLGSGTLGPALLGDARQRKVEKVSAQPSRRDPYSARAVHSSLAMRQCTQAVSCVA